MPSTRGGGQEEGGVGVGRGQQAMEVGGEAREVPLPGEEPRLGLEKGRASGPGGLAGLPVGVAGFPHFRPVNNIGQSVTQAPQVVQDHLLWPKSDGKEASLSRSSRISMSTSSSSPTASVGTSDGGGWWT